MIWSVRKEDTYNQLDGKTQICSLTFDVKTILTGSISFEDFIFTTWVKSDATDDRLQN